LEDLKVLTAVLMKSQVLYRISPVSTAKYLPRGWRQRTAAETSVTGYQSSKCLHPSRFKPCVKRLGFIPSSVTCKLACRWWNSFISYMSWISWPFSRATYDLM